MKILYKQSSQLQKISLLEQLGVSNCHFKQVDPMQDSGFREETLPDTQDEDSRVSMARQYVLDNIERPITCPESANYCHLSQKQLTRLFQQYTDTTPAAYIRTQKVQRIEMLLTESNLTLRRISDRLHFASENHFNSFFTKYARLTPGAYRKMNNRSAQ